MGEIRKYYHGITNTYIPNFSIPKDIERDIESCDALIVIGGDNITLDYGLESLIWHVRFAQHAQRLGKTVMVWGASIGPFNTDPIAEKFIANFLKSTSCITVRETISEKYLNTIGVTKNLALVADGAFVMTPETLDISTYWPKKERTVLGFNISPLIQKFRPANEPKEVLQKEVAAFIKHTLDTSDTSIVLIPHVDPLDGIENNSDTFYMREILSMCGGYGSRLTMVPNTLNAAQLKFVLSQCTFFIGARTHATIGALSCLVPTISIAYSIKAKGLNRDLFDNEDYVLETPSVSNASLQKYYQRLVDDRSSVVNLLALKIPLWRKKANLSASNLAQVIGK